MFVPHIPLTSNITNNGKCQRYDGSDKRINYGLAKTIGKHMSLSDDYSNVKKINTIDIPFFDHYK